MLCFNYQSTVHGCWCDRLLEVVFNEQNLVPIPKVVIDKEKCLTIYIIITIMSAKNIKVKE